MDRGPPGTSSVSGGAVSSATTEGERRKSRLCIMLEIEQLFCCHAPWLSRLVTYHVGLAGWVCAMDDPGARSDA